MAFPSLFRQTLRSSAPAIAAVLAEVEAWCEDHDLVPRVGMQLVLMLDEWLTNLAAHAYVGSEGEIVVELVAASPSTVDVTVRDWGPPFDPTARAAPDVTLGIDEREIGGLGIHLIARLASHMSYQREGDTNLLRFGKATPET